MPSVPSRDIRWLVQLEGKYGQQPHSTAAGALLVTQHPGFVSFLLPVPTGHLVPAEGFLTNPPEPGGSAFFAVSFHDHLHANDEAMQKIQLVSIREVVPWV